MLGVVLEIIFWLQMPPTYIHHVCAVALHKFSYEGCKYASHFVLDTVMKFFSQIVLKSKQL